MLAIFRKYAQSFVTLFRGDSHRQKDEPAWLSCSKRRRGAEEGAKFGYFPQIRPIVNDEFAENSQHLALSSTPLLRLTEEVQVVDVKLFESLFPCILLVDYL